MTIPPTGRFMYAFPVLEIFAICNLLHATSIIPSPWYLVPLGMKKKQNPVICSFLQLLTSIVCVKPERGGMCGQLHPRGCAMTCGAPIASRSAIAPTRVFNRARAALPGRFLSAILRATPDSSCPAPRPLVYIAATPPMR